MMQTQLTGALRQKERLAQLGGLLPRSAMICAIS